MASNINSFTDLLEEFYGKTVSFRNWISRFYYEKILPFPISPRADKHHYPFLRRVDNLFFIFYLFARLKNSKYY